jgi:hypothetical protein
MVCIKMFRGKLIREGVEEKRTRKADVYASGGRERNDDGEVEEVEE